MKICVKNNAGMEVKMKISVKKLLLYVSAFVIVFTGILAGLPYKAQAAENSSSLAKQYLNSQVKYLIMGASDTETYNFNIKKDAKQKGAKYSWYINENKGNPDAISIDSKSGVVVAEEAGTAYIRCKITLPDGKVLQPEAKVIVRNNITAVDISNINENLTVVSGAAIDFDRKIIDTAAGKGKKTQGITRWEIKEDTAGVGSVSDKGIARTTKSGSFAIRAVCFQSKEKYKEWLSDKENNNHLITAASQWYTVKVEDVKPDVTEEPQVKESEPVTSNQTQRSRIEVEPVKLTTDKVNIVEAFDECFNIKIDGVDVTANIIDIERTSDNLKNKVYISKVTVYEIIAGYAVYYEVPIGYYITVPVDFQQ